MKKRRFRVKESCFRKVVYIAGPYRAPSISGVVANIRRAEAVAVQVWRSGAVALCPHLNTSLFDGLCPDEVWLAGDLELLRRCDAVIMVGGWRLSKGAVSEKQRAEQWGKPIFTSIAGLRKWLK